MAGSALIGSLAVNLTMETAAFQRGATIAEKRATAMQGKFSKMTGTFKTFAVGFAGGIAAGVVPAVTGVVAGAFQMAAALSEASEKVGLTVEALQEMRLAASQNGLSNDQLENSLARMNKSLGALQQGSGPAAAAFARIGLSADELKGKSPDQAFALIAEGLNGIPDASERAAAGQAIFGRSYADLIPLVNGGAEALRKAAEESRRNGQISTEDAKKLDELADGWGKLKVRVGVAIVNIVADVVKFAQGVDAGFKAAGKWIRDFDAAALQMGRNFVTYMSNMVSGVANAITGRLSAIWDGAKKQIEGFRAATKWLFDKVVGHSDIPDMVTLVGFHMGPRLAQLMAPAALTIERTATAFQEGATEMGEQVKKTNAEVIEGFGQMAAGAIGSVRSMVDTFKSGDILGGIQQLLQLVLQVAQAFGQLGIIKLPTATPPIAGARAGGGPVSAGKSYLVGEKGPEIVTFGRRGYVTPNKGSSGQMRIQIVPSPYFNAVVDGRARAVAGPIVGQGMVAAVGASDVRAARAARRNIGSAR